MDNGVTRHPSRHLPPCHDMHRIHWCIQYKKTNLPASSRMQLRLFGSGIRPPNTKSHINLDNGVPRVRGEPPPSAARSACFGSTGAFSIRKTSRLRLFTGLLSRFTSIDSKSDNRVTLKPGAVTSSCHTAGVISIGVFSTRKQHQRRRSQFKPNLQVSPIPYPNH